ncbi:MAG TPA: hypothetical protein VFE54_08905 [Mucilaginibacter sp.]|jgi:hypothetical protein|nr:hypothetical protein [Mucilaginibacter sp.]
MDTPLIKSSLTNEDTDFNGHLKAYYDYLRTHVATTAMVSAALGIKEKNLTWLKRRLEKAGQLRVLYRDKCKATGCRAAYLTTNATLIAGNNEDGSGPRKEIAHGR